MTLYLSLGRRAKNIATLFSPRRPFVFLQIIPRMIKRTNKRITITPEPFTRFTSFGAPD
jgi:hypothetical protein